MCGTQDLGGRNTKGEHDDVTIGHTLLEMLCPQLLVFDSPYHLGKDSGFPFLVLCQVLSVLVELIVDDPPGTLCVFENMCTPHPTQACVCVSPPIETIPEGLGTRPSQLNL